MPARPRLRPLAYPVCFVAGGLLGAGWDQLHVQTETLTYTDTTFAGQAWWVPVEFGLVYAAGIPLFIATGDPAPAADGYRKLGLELVWATAIYATTAFFHPAPWLVVAMLLIAALVRLGALRIVAAANPVPVAALVVLGPLTESMLSASGVFGYASTELGNIPAWLPLLYLNLTPFVTRAAEAALKAYGTRRTVAA